MLEALGQEPDVCHMNEGHAAFVVLARAYSFMKEDRIVYESSPLGHSRPGMSLQLIRRLRQDSIVSAILWLKSMPGFMQIFWASAIRIS